MTSTSLGRLFFYAALLPAISLAGDYEVLGVKVIRSPDWLKKEEVEAILLDVEKRTGWKASAGLEVVFHPDDGGFNLALIEAGLPSRPVWGFAGRGKIVIGPRATPENFKTAFMHELGHFVSWSLFQGLPNSLEEGYAEWVSQNPDLSFGWINRQRKTIDPRTVVFDPMRDGGSDADISYRYALSYATVLFLAERCPDLNVFLLKSKSKDLFELAATECKIPFFMVDFQNWINEQALNGDRPKFK